MKENETKKECMLCHTTMHKQGIEYNGKELTAEIYRSFKVDFELKELDKFDRETQLFVCPACKFGVFLPQIDAPADFYEKLSSTPGYYPKKRWDFAEAVCDIPKEGRVLDVGCGAGAFLDIARSKGVEVVGCEENPKGLQACFQKGIKAFKSLAEIKEQDFMFDAVFSFQVLEHVMDPLAFLNELSSFVKPGGVVGMSVPNMDGVLRYIDPCFSNMPPHHATQWRADTIAVLTQKSGMKVERISFEPLSRMHLSYYSQEFARRIFSANSTSTKMRLKIFEKLISLGLLTMIILFRIFKYKKFPFLHDMSLYVLMKK